MACASNDNCWVRWRCVNWKLRRPPHIYAIRCKGNSLRVAPGVLTCWPLCHQSQEVASHVVLRRCILAPYYVPHSDSGIFLLFSPTESLETIRSLRLLHATYLSHLGDGHDTGQRRSSVAPRHKEGANSFKTFSKRCRWSRVHKLAHAAVLTAWQVFNTDICISQLNQTFATPPFQRRRTQMILPSK